MKNEHYEFIEDEHLPCIEKMRKAASEVKDLGPWIIDPIYGFLMDKNCEPVDLWSDQGHPSTNLDFIEVCNPLSVTYLLTQRDELLSLIKQAMEFLEPIRFMRSSDDEKAVQLDIMMRAAIAKAEQK